MASAMLGSSFYIFTTYAATIRHGVAAAVHAENGFGPGYVTVSEEAQTSAASGDTTSTYAVNDHKTVNANAASESSIDNVASLSTTDTINDAYKTVVTTTSEIGNDKTVTDFDGSYDYTTPVKSDDEAWADLQKAPAGGGNKGGWGNSYSGANSIPRGNIDEATMHTYSGYSRSSDTTSKVIYLTFDEGYENGYTPTFLDVLKTWHPWNIFRDRFLPEVAARPREADGCGGTYRRKPHAEASVDVDNHDARGLLESAEIKFRSLLSDDRLSDASLLSTAGAALSASRSFRKRRQWATGRFSGVSPISTGM